MISTVRKLHYLFDTRAKRQFAALLVMMMIAAGLEALGIALILPAMHVLVSPDTIAEQRYLGPVYRWSGASDSGQFALFALIALLVTYVFKNLFLLLLNYLQMRLVADNIARLKAAFFRGYVHCPTVYHLQTNSATIMRNVWSSCHAILGGGIGPMLTLITELLVALAISALLVAVAPVSTLIAVAVLGLVGSGFFFFAKNHLQRWGRNKQALEADIMQWINQGIGSLNEIKLVGHEGFLTGRFEAMNLSWARYKRLQDFFNFTPRVVIEIIMVFTLAGVAVVTTQGSRPPTESVAYLALFGMAAIRLMPSATRIATALNDMRFNSAMIDVLYKDKLMFESLANVGLPNANSGEIEFGRTLVLDGIRFSYPGAQGPSLNGVSLSIDQGEAIALVGPSGAGKTTLALILMGLLAPDEGTVTSDGQPITMTSRMWRSKIGYIPQDIYLLDDTLRHNIALGVDDGEIDERRLRDAIDAAQLSTVIDNLPDGLETVLGERGVRLSGGQRQRVAIARALYVDPEILVMDEATSSLDTGTEKELVNAVSRLRGYKTIVVIAHRMSTVRHCDRLHFMQSGRIVDTGTYDEMVAGNPDFRRVALGEADPPVEAVAQHQHR